MSTSSGPGQWGGEYFGGYDSNDNYAGGGDGYDGYGVDCSGLVSIGAYIVDADQDGHDYDWSPWRCTTSTLPGVTSAVTSPWMDNIQPGDIMNKPQHHVVSYLYTAGQSPNRIFVVIEATGKPYNKVHRTDDYDPITHYTESELNQECDLPPSTLPLTVSYTEHKPALMPGSAAGARRSLAPAAGRPERGAGQVTGLVVKPSRPHPCRAYRLSCTSR